MPKMIFVALVGLGLLAGAYGTRNRLSLAGQARQRAMEGAWSRELQHAKEVNPVRRVINLLTKMKAELDDEADKESEMYDKMVCWCETSEKEKTKATADAEASDKALLAEIETRSARLGELSTEIATLKKQVAEGAEAMQKATGIGEQEAIAARDEEKELVQAIVNLKNAIAVLSSAHGSSLLEQGTPLVSGLQVLLRDASIRYEMLQAGRPGPRRNSFLALGTETMNSRESGASGKEDDQAVTHALFDALDVRGAGIPELPLKFAERVVAQSMARPLAAEPVAPAVFLQITQQGPESHAPTSGQIYGVLQQMLEDFQARLKEVQNDAGKSAEGYKALAGAKQQQNTVAKEKLDDLETENAANHKALSDAKANLELTRKQRSADVEFLQNLRLTCNDLDKDWEERSQTRSAEAKAVAEALAVLTEDDNRDTLSKSVSLLQERARLGTSAATGRRARAAAALRRAAEDDLLDTDDLVATWQARRGGVTPADAGLGAAPRAQLSSLAMRVQLDGFEKVKESMDKMVSELKKQQAEEVKSKAYCQKELNENEKATLSKTETKKDLTMMIDGLAAEVARLGEELSKAEAEIAKTQTEMKEASEAREKGNSEFQTVVADQQATQTILKAALMKLEQFYNNKGSFGQVSFRQRGNQVPPAQFTKYKTHAGASPVMGLLKDILEGSKKLESEATANEKRAQADYERFVADSNAIIKELSEAVTAKTKALADSKLDTAETKSSLESTDAELESLASYEADLHKQCDWLLKNFNVRQKARLQEIEAIQGAKAILSGA